MPRRTGRSGSSTLELDAAVRHEARTGLGDLRCDRERIGGAAHAAGLVPGGRDERVDDLRELLRVAVHDLERRPVVLGRAFPKQGELGLCEDACDRRAQLVRELGGETLLVPQARGEPVEEPVERRGELGQLVVRVADGEPLVEIALAPRCGLSRHATHRTEVRRREQPARGDRDEQEHDAAEDQRSDERDASRVLLGLQRARHDDGAEPAAGDDDGDRVETGVGAGEVGEARRAAGEPSSGGVHTRTGARLLDHVPVREDPHVGVRAGRVGDVQKDQPAVIFANERELLGRPRAQEVVRVRVESVGERHVERDEQRGDGCRDRGDDHEQQAPAYPERPHWSR